MSAKNLISLEICKEHFNYDDEGNLYWKKLFSENCRNGKAKVGEIAGCFHRTTGYYIVRLGGKRYQTHRILYQMYNNIELKYNEDIDHINLDKTDNRKENLRICNMSQNQSNRKTQKNNLSTGIKNISIANRNSSYKLTIAKNNKVYSKYFRIDQYSLEDVIKIRDEKLKEMHGEFMNKG